jgi:AbrB family looped-hinge helix DNA binding protein
MGRVTTMTSKGQVTIPKEIREALGLQPGDKIRFIPEEGRVRLERLLRLEEIAGMLPPLDISIDEAIELAKEEHARERYEKMQRW